MWWWEPGGLGCSTRSTGPGVFHAQTSVGTRLPSGDIKIHFPLQRIMADPLDVRLLVQEGGMRVLNSGGWTPTVRQAVLEVPLSTRLP
jgi:hypothetical protein